MVKTKALKSKAPRKPTQNIGDKVAKKIKMKLKTIKQKGPNTDAVDSDSSKESFDKSIHAKDTAM